MFEARWSWTRANGEDAMLHEPKSVAKAVKGRQGRKIVQRELVPAPAVHLRARKKAKAKAPTPAVATGGKGRKTGMVLARAKLGSATSDKIKKDLWRARAPSP